MFVVTLGDAFGTPQVFHQASNVLVVEFRKELFENFFVRGVF